MSEHNPVNPAGGTSWWHRLPFDPARSWALLRYVARQFGRDNCLTYSGMLTFNTLLALVPLITVVTIVLAALPVADDLTLRFQAFLADFLVPEKQETIRQTLFSLATDTTRLSAAMSVFLLVTSLMLMFTVEKTFNRIWGVKTPRPLLSRFIIFWTVLTIGPILLLSSIAISSYFFSLEILDRAPAVGMLRGMLLSLTPALVTVLAFFLGFLIVPNRSVPWRHALFGAVITAIMFEVAKAGFGLYLRSFDGYERIYGALSAVPIFILWIYLSWSVILLGASLTASLGSFRYRRGASYPVQAEFLLLFRLMGHLWRAQSEGRGLQTEALLREEPGADDHQVQELLENLRRASVVRRGEQGEWLLVRDLDDLTLAELYATGAYVWPMPDADLEGSDDGWNQAFRQALAGAAEPLAEVTGRSLKSFYLTTGPKCRNDNLRLV